ncbi:hypothetical protein NOVA_27210 [Nocardia nova]|uniref:hypothetical protein n=1 Tax=Nocardia nova TaxID=37330 RepID=UPI001C47947E|nr:hypothetical protein [Nocardia nova]MBV7706480.1 hypothetical protein [Nocardia nova]
MKFVPESVLGMAQTMEPAATATQAHARQIAEVGFEPSHAGQDYGHEGAKLAAGVDSIVALLQSWSEASTATAGALRHTVTVITTADQRNRTQIERAGEAEGSA